jgi:hypothetical protein
MPRTIAVAADRMQWISTGNVERLVKWVDAGGRRTPTDDQDRNDAGVLLWAVEVIVPGEDGGRTEVVRVTVAQNSEPEGFSFGELLTFDEMTVAVWSSKDSRNVGQGWNATGVRRAAPAGRQSRTEAAA